MAKKRLLTQEEYATFTSKQKKKVWRKFLKDKDVDDFFGHYMPTRDYRNRFMPEGIYVTE